MRNKSKDSKQTNPLIINSIPISLSQSELDRVCYLLDKDWSLIKRHNRMAEQSLERLKSHINKLRGSSISISSEHIDL